MTIRRGILPAVAWLLAAALCLPVHAYATQSNADPAAWGVYARLLGTEFAGNGDWASWQLAPDGSIVEDRAILAKTVIRPGVRAGELIGVYGGGLHTFDGRIAPDGSVTWIRRGRFLKMPSRVSIVDGQFVEEALRLDKDEQVVAVTKTLRFAQQSGPSVATDPTDAAPVSVASTATPAAVSVPDVAAAAASPERPASPTTPARSTAPVAPAVAASPAAAQGAPAASNPAAPKTGPRTLSAAELATLRQRMQADGARRAQAHSQEQAVAEQQRQQLEQMQMAAAEDTYWEDEAPAPAPNLAEVFLNTLNSEMAKHQAEQQAQDAFIRDIQRQQAAAMERRQREEERQRREIERLQQQTSRQASATPRAPTADEAAAQVARARATEERERQLATQVAAERARLQQSRTQSPLAAAAVAAAPASTTSATASSAEAAVKPLRFILSIGLRNLPGDTVNPMCYSNVITRPGPPGWGGGGFLPQGSGQQAHDIVQSFKAAFIAKCRASGREIDSEGNFNYSWNRSSTEEANMQQVGPRHREDVQVTL